MVKGMFSNFKKAFKVDESNTKIPDAVIDALSDNLPVGFKYTQVDKEAIGIITTSERMQMKVNLKYPYDFKPESTEELMEYLYRTQQELSVPTNSIEINGHSFTPEQLINFPLSEIKVSNDDFNLVIKPYPFPEPFQVFIELEDKDFTRKNFQIKRQPYAHMEKSHFKSIDIGPLKLSYVIDEKNHSLNLTLKLNIDNADNPKDAVEAYKIYNGFIQGKISFNGAELNAVPNKNEDLASIKEAIKLWEKVDLIGEKLKKDFKPNDNLSQNDVLWIEKLYKSFIKEEPYKEYIKIDSMATEVVDIDKEEIMNSKGLALQFINNEEIKLLGENIILYNLVAMFDLKVIEILEKEDKKYEFIIEPTTNNGIYRSVQHFINENDINKYKPFELLQGLQKAELLSSDITD
ncbi:abortive infection system toxin AbiGii family protein [Sporosarcina cyprini]|uniref:abortive infection system toxin AbiGii family protein n=1 Tax=Sporosarcina cyprini TaxID=2910523 RepID=UPI001EDD6FA7|nr:abortive infection system toxin AbiGii family protein [Sporosarcina cyprini]MCG3086384.1 abortive infection system toxin AbiGii family protein [Sporosarcina cyprini]